MKNRLILSNTLAISLALATLCSKASAEDPVLDLTEIQTSINNGIQQDVQGRATGTVEMPWYAPDIDWVVDFSATAILQGAPTVYCFKNAEGLVNPIDISAAALPANLVDTAINSAAVLNCLPNFADSGAIEVLIPVDFTFHSTITVDGGDAQVSIQNAKIWIGITVPFLGPVPDSGETLVSITLEGGSTVSGLGDEIFVAQALGGTLLTVAIGNPLGFFAGLFIDEEEINDAIEEAINTNIDEALFSASAGLTNEVQSAIPSLKDAFDGLAAALMLSTI